MLLCEHLLFIWQKTSQYPHEALRPQRDRYRLSFSRIAASYVFMFERSRLQEGAPFRCTQRHAHPSSILFHFCLRGGHHQQRPDRLGLARLATSSGEYNSRRPVSVGGCAVSIKVIQRRGMNPAANSTPIPSASEIYSGRLSICTGSISSAGV